MADLQGVAFYPGVIQVRRCRYTMTHGDTPDVAILEILPQQAASIAKRGNLTLQFGFTTITLQDCRVDFGTLYTSSQGQIVELHILDRRWKWRFGRIVGAWNLRQEDGTLDTNTEKTPQELATMLLDAMGESGYDVSQLPNTGRPTVDWDCATPAHELSRLCDDRGCRIALGLDNVVRLVPLGSGAALPVGGVRTLAHGLNAAEAPNQVRLCGAEVLFDSKIELEAVGEDVDGSIVPIDSLTYKPNPGGWESIKSIPKDVLTDAATTQQRALARKTVWKWWRVKQQADGTQNVPGYSGSVTSIAQILPLAARRNTVYTDSDGNIRLAPAFIEGTFVIESEPGTAPASGTPNTTNTAAGTTYDGEFTIDRKLGIIKFPKAMRQYNDATTQYDPASLYLTTTYHVTDASTNQKVRFERWQTVDPTVNTKPEIIRREEVQVLVTASYDSSNTVTGTTDNQAAMESLADDYISAYATKYQHVESFRAEYQGLIPIALDGATRQVTWVVDMNRGANTWASYNSEFELGVLRYHHKRRRVRNRERSRRENAERTLERNRRIMRARGRGDA